MNMCDAQMIFDRITGEYGKRLPPVAYPISVSNLQTLISGGAEKIQINVVKDNHFEHTVKYRGRLFTAINTDQIST